MNSLKKCLYSTEGSPISKKIKKVVKSVGKVAKTVTGVNLVKDAFGELTGANAAEAAAKRQAAQQAQIAAAQQNLERNLAMDLTNQNTADVVAGGSANASDDPARKRRRGGAGLSSTLGIV